MLAVMIAGSALVLYAGARREAAHEVPEVREPSHERAWLTPEAASEVFGAPGELGPLFEGVVLGGPAPSPEARARIAAFARANNVEIDLDMVDGTLAAIRFDVTFGGCCGYEGADVLARRLGRPRTYECCGCSSDWVDDWTFSNDSMHMRARVRVNRVAVRWEKTISLPELLDRAEALLGQNAEAVAVAAGDKWLDDRGTHLLDVPYPVVPSRIASSAAELGLEVTTDAGRISDVKFAVSDRAEPGRVEVLAAARRARWGRPRGPRDRWTWRRADRVITADVTEGPVSIRISTPDATVTP